MGVEIIVVISRDIMYNVIVYLYNKRKVEKKGI